MHKMNWVTTLLSDIVYKWKLVIMIVFYNHIQIIVYDCSGGKHRQVYVRRKLFVIDFV